MGENRITYFGWTDYTVASLELIISDLKKDFYTLTRERIEKLGEIKKEVMDNYKRLDDPEEIIGYIEFFITLFKSFEYDFKRILDEIPQGIETKHIDIINQIHKRCRHEDKISALGFKEEHIAKELKDESLRPLLDEIYIVTRDSTSRNKVLLPHLSKRLKTFIGSKPNGQEIIRQDEKKKPRVHKVIPFTTPPGTSWQDITIHFFSNKAVWLIAGEKKEGKEFPEVGLSHFTSNKPTILCLTLVSFGKYKEISWNTPGIHPKVNKNLKTHIYRLNKLLMEIFQIEKEKPFEYCFRTKTYSPIFKITLRNDEIYDDILDDFKLRDHLPYQKIFDN